jgi:23S rRNA pseudoU1915 N3-methylase RlmH
MPSTKKTIGAFSASTLVVGGILFAPLVAAQGRTAAPSRSQQEVQSALAEQTRNLADQYANRRFGTEASPVVEEKAPAAVQEDFERALRNRTERISRTQPSTANVQMVTPPTASVESRMVAEAMPSLSSSGFGLSTMAVALGISGALRGRRKFERAL